MVIYNLLGKDAENSFSTQWAVGYVMDNASQWQEILKTALKAALIMYILDRLRLVGDIVWFEHHIDTLSIQAALANQQFGWMDRTIQYIKFTSRVA